MPRTDYAVFLGRSHMDIFPSSKRPFIDSGVSQPSRRCILFSYHGAQSYVSTIALEGDLKCNGRRKMLIRTATTEYVVDKVLSTQQTFHITSDSTHHIESVQKPVVPISNKPHTITTQVSCGCLSLPCNPMR
jgi:hypothetical protein